MTFTIDVLFEYKDDDETALIWCQGMAIKFIMESQNKNAIARVRMNKECLREGCLLETREKLQKENEIPKITQMGFGKKTCIVN